MSIDYDTLVAIMEQIREMDYPKSVQIKAFIEDVKEHFGETREGS